MIERHTIADRATWLALRSQDITASDVAIVCGEGAYASMAELYAEKKGLRPPLIDSGVLQRGRWGEASVFEALAEKKPTWEIRRAKIYLRDPELRLGATPDGFALGPDHDGMIVIQAKTVSRWMFRHAWLHDPDDDIEHGDATIPESYRLPDVDRSIAGRRTHGVPGRTGQQRIRLAFPFV